MGREVLGFRLIPVGCVLDPGCMHVPMTEDWELADTHTSPLEGPRNTLHSHEMHLQVDRHTEDLQVRMITHHPTQMYQLSYSLLKLLLQLLLHDAVTYSV